MNIRHRSHGNGPLGVVVVHGGPGCAGEVAPVAQELAARGHGVFEPFQTEASLAGQVRELRDQIERACEPPVTLIGWSWGAWLGCLVAARHPHIVRKLVLVGSGPFDERDARTIKEIRQSRLTPSERAEYADLSSDFGGSNARARIMQLFDKMDAYAPDGTQPADIVYDRAIHESVWAEGSLLRKTANLWNSSPRSGVRWWRCTAITTRIRRKA